MGKSVAVGGTVSEEIADALARLAAATGRSESWLVSEAVSAYVETEQAFLDAVAEGLEDIEAGRLLPHEQVVREFAGRYDRD